MVADGARDANAARRRQPLQPHRDVDAVALNFAAVGDHVAEIDANAKAQALLLGEIQIAVRHRALNSLAQRTASTTLANSASTPSPVVLTMRP